MPTRLFAALLVTGVLALAGQAAAVQVWVNAGSGVYHCPGTRYYQNTKRGELIEEDQARESGFRPAHGRACSGSASLSGSSATALGARGSASAATEARVWVNPSSHVYHCPGTRYYGKTKRGEYLPESEAIARGNRAAYGERCN